MNSGEGGGQEGRVRAAFAQHGVILRPAGGGTQFIGDSPFAPPGRGKDKLYVHRLAGVWDCKISGLSGNLARFFAEKSRLNEAAFRGVAALKLSGERGLPTEALRAWRVGWDGRQYTIPADACGQTYDLRRYTVGGKIQSSSGARASLSGITVPGADEVFLAEGEWDGVAAWDMVRTAGVKASVYSAPGAGSFPPHSHPLFQGKLVRVLYDADDAGRRGSARVGRALTGIAKELLYVAWPEGVKDGYDVRDFYKEGRGLEDLRKLLTPECPGGPVGGSGPSAAEEESKLTGEGLPPEEVLRRYRKNLYLPHAEVLDVLYGAVWANRLPGDPIWLLLVAPPGGSKTELIMSLSEAPLIRTISSLTPRTLVSGAPAAGGGDPSLLPQLNGRVLGIKDFTTLLTMNPQARDEIFGTLREVYDGRFEKGWGTGLFRRYDSRFGIIAGVTPVIETHAASSSVLGERFIRYRIPRVARLAGDDAIIDAALAALNKEAGMRSALQETSRAVLGRPTPPPPEIPADLRVRFRRLAQWTAALRGVVARDARGGTVLYKPSAEVGTRLAKQFAKLAQGIAVYGFRAEVRESDYRAVLHVARSTVPDRVEELVRLMYQEEKAAGEEGREPFPGGFIPSVAPTLRLDAPTVRLVLADLELLRVVVREAPPARKSPAAGRPGRNGLPGKTVYRLSKALRALMDGLDLYRREGGWAEARKTVRLDIRRPAREEVPVG